MNGLILAVLFVVFALLEGASALKCIHCSSLHDDKCGKTFGYSMKEAENAGLVKVCEGDTVACRKTETRDTPNSVVVFSRSCWNATANENLKEDFFKCKELMTRVEVCYCKAGDKDEPCNGQDWIKPTFAFTLLGLFPFIVKTIF